MAKIVSPADRADSTVSPTKRLTVGLASMFLSVWATAQEAPVLSEDAFIGDLPVVLSVTRLEQPKAEAPAAVTVIDREMIRASGVRNIADLFWLVPGFQVGYSHATNPIVTYHGFSDSRARRMQVLVDGRSVYSTLGDVQWIALPLAIDDIERLEVIRGPNAAAYGSNSFLGVINIITRHSSQEPGVSGRVTAGEHDVLDGFARQAWARNNINARLSASYQQDDGFDNLYDSSQVRILSFRSDGRVSSTDTLEAQLGANVTEHDAGAPDKPTNVLRTREIMASFQSLRWRHTFDAHNETSVQFYHNYTKNDDDYLTAPQTVVPFGTIQIPISFDTVEERYDLEFQHVLGVFPAWRFVWGSGARLDRVRSRTFFATDDALENRLYRFFGNAEWRLGPDSIINAGAMWEHHQTYGNDFSPRLALNHYLSPAHSVRLVASRASRTPSLVDDRADTRFYYQSVLLDQTIKAQGDKQPETMTSYELGYLGQFSRWNSTLDIRLFRDELRHLLTSVTIPVADLDGGALSTMNGGELDVSGLELQLSYRPTPMDRILFSYAAMRAHADNSEVRTQAESIGGTANADEAAAEDSVPRYSLSLLAIHRFADRWETSLKYQRVSEMRWLGSGDFVGSNGRLDVRLGRDLRGARTRGQVALTIQGLGQKSASFDPENVFDRRAFVTLQLHY